jgi:hypothetical protein
MNQFQIDFLSQQLENVRLKIDHLSFATPKTKQLRSFQSSLLQLALERDRLIFELNALQNSHGLNTS